MNPEKISAGNGADEAPKEATEVGSPEVGAASGQARAAAAEVLKVSSGSQPQTHGWGGSHQKTHGVGW